MRRLILFLLALSLLPIFRMPASAQMSNMPEDLRARLAEINPTWGKDILCNVATTLALYTPILAAAPKDGVRIERDLAYGPDALHRLDLHKQEGRTGMPIVVFLHGGAYARGSRSVNTEVYGNVATYFARQGMLGVNGTYRLAPAAQWPAAAQDVGLLNSERPKTEHSKWRGRLSTGETEQPGPNNGFGRSSKRLKRNCSLGGHPPAGKGSQSISPTVALLNGR